MTANLESTARGVNIALSIRHAMDPGPLSEPLPAPAPSPVVDEEPPPTPTPRPLRKRALKGLYWLLYRARSFVLTPLTAEFAAIGERQRALTEAIAKTSAQLQHLQDHLTRVEAAQGRQLAVLRADFRAELSLLQRAVAGVPSTLGPRLDELEIKVRPLVAFDDESYAVRLADGYLMTPRSEPTFTTMLANAPSGGLEAGTRRVLQALIDPGMAVADVGANVGLLTLACARAAGPTGQVHAFEPEPGPRRQLEKTCALNGLSWVVPHATAVGRTAERRTFHVSPIIGHSSLYALPQDERAGAHDLEVEVTTLDVALDPAVVLDVVKIDVEGGELDVLAGMTRHIAANPNLAIVAEFGPSHLERLGLDPQLWWAAFREQQFTAYAIDEPGGACVPVSLEAALQAVSTNLVFVRPGSAAEQRLPLA